MSYRVMPIAPNVLGVDTLANLKVTQCRSLIQRGYGFRGGYVDEMTPLEMQGQVNEGLPLLLYTYANEFDPAHTLARLAALSVPAGANVILDVEAVASPADIAAMTPADLETFVQGLIGKINAWGKGMSNHAFLPCIYFGGLQLLTSDEMSALAVYRYHEGAARLRDRFNKPSDPERGFAMKQGRPVNVDLLGDGTLFDVDFHCLDYHDNGFSAVVAA